MQIRHKFQFREAPRKGFSQDATHMQNTLPPGKHHFTQEKWRKVHYRYRRVYMHGFRYLCLLQRNVWEADVSSSPFLCMYSSYFGYWQRAWIMNLNAGLKCTVLTTDIINRKMLYIRLTLKQSKKSSFLLVRS